MNRISYNKQKGITLVALVVTIIVLLILAGITIAQLTGSGLIKKAQLAAKETQYANAAEKVVLAVNASYDTTGKINGDLLKDNVNKIDGLDKKVETVTFDLKIVVDGFEFTISEYGQITGEKTEVATLPENTEDTDAGTPVKLPSDWGTQNVSYIKTTDGTEVTTLETVATVYAISDGNNNTIPVPYNFYYVGGNKDTGIVISDNPADKYEKGKDKTTHAYATQLKGNQFVWIPCSIDNYKKINVWNGVTQQGTTLQNANWDMETNAAEYEQIEKYGGFYVGRYEAGVSTLNETTGQFENSVTFNNSKSLFSAVAIQTGINSWGWQNYDFIARGNLVPDSNYPNKATGNIVEKANSIPYYHADYYTAVEMTRRMYKNDTVRNKYVTSGLVTGTQWDMICKYMQDNGINVQSSNWGNYNNVSLGTTEDTKLRGYYTNVTSSGATDGFKSVTDASEPLSNSGIRKSGYSYVLLTTGSTEQVKKMNLYDIAGNLWEWTQEASYIKNLYYNLNITYNSYMLRGGSFYNDYAGCPACFRAYDYAPSTSANSGFRATLYIK